MNREQVAKVIEKHLEEGHIDKAKAAAQEFNLQHQMELCFTSRQIEGLRILDNVINTNEKIDEEQKELLEELVQIKYTIEKSIFDMKCEKYSQTIQGFRL